MQHASTTREKMQHRIQNAPQRTRQAETVGLEQVRRLSSSIRKALFPDRRSWASMQTDEARREFWQRFTAISNVPGVFKLLLKCLSKESERLLRGVDRAMRRAVNRTVTEVRYDLRRWDRADRGPYTHPEQDLAEAFPDADQLVFAFTEHKAGYGPTMIDHHVQLGRIATASPRFVSKLRVLEIRFESRCIAEIVDVLAELLPRYARTLQSVDLTVPTK
jgi:hypothetical protein